jgi:hypothetical protein
MALVAIIALDFAEIRALQGATGIAVGALPMANILGAVYLALRRKPDSRAFLLGFQAFGMFAIAAFVIAISYYEHQIIMNYIVPLRRPIENLMDHESPLLRVAAVFPVVVLAIALPQLLFAFLGGYFARRYRGNLQKADLNYGGHMRKVDSSEDRSASNEHRNRGHHSTSPDDLGDYPVEDECRRSCR